LNRRESGRFGTGFEVTFGVGLVLRGRWLRDGTWIGVTVAVGISWAVRVIPNDIKT